MRVIRCRREREGRGVLRRVKEAALERTVDLRRGEKNEGAWRRL